MNSFFRNLEVLHLGIKYVKNIWNLKQVWITPKSFCDFQAYCQVFAFVRNDISHAILQEMYYVFWLTVEWFHKTSEIAKKINLAKWIRAILLEPWNSW